MVWSVSLLMFLSFSSHLLSVRCVLLHVQLDIVFFHEPDDCEPSPTGKGCDWTALGIGKRLETGLRWCCTKEAATYGFCDGGQDLNRLIIQDGPDGNFTGQLRKMIIPASGDMLPHLMNPYLEAAEDSGKYVLLFANCNAAARDVYIAGKYSWKSKHGFLPGNIFGEMYFFYALVVIYLGLLLWYGFTMRLYEDSAIPIQNWIVLAITLGLLESLCRAGDYAAWNEDGERFWFARYVGMILGVAKQSISACLLVMVSLGWGVVRDDLGSNLRWIIVLGVFYVLTDTANEILPIILAEESTSISNDEESKMINMETISKIIVDIVCIIFYLWILDALNATMQYLENMGQSIKLQRYLRLRTLLLFSLLFAVVWFVFGTVDQTFPGGGMLPSSEKWMVNALYEINFFALLLGIAILWRPNPNARDFAYVMEIAGDEGDCENELEMTANIPSAMDDDDDDEEDEEGGDGNGEEGGYKDENGHSGGYKDDVPATK